MGKDGWIGTRKKVIVRESWVLVQALSLIDVGPAKPAITSLMLNFLTKANEVILKDDLAEGTSTSANEWVFDCESCIRVRKIWLGWCAVLKKKKLHWSRRSCLIDKFLQNRNDSGGPELQQDSPPLENHAIRVTLGNRQHLEVLAGWRLFAEGRWLVLGGGFPETGNCQRSSQADGLHQGDPKVKGLGFKVEI